MTTLRPEGTDPDTGRKRWSLELLEIEASILRGLPDQLRALLADPEANRAVIDRLFPASYADPEEERASRELLGAGLLHERQEMLDAIDLELSAGAPTESDGLRLDLQAPQIDLWLRFLNDVRLVLATDLGLDAAGEDDDPDALADPKRALLEYLGGLESILVEAARKEF